MGLDYYSSKNGNSATDAYIKTLRWLMELIAWSTIASANNQHKAAAANVDNTPLPSQVLYALAIFIIAWILDTIWIFIHIAGLNERINMNLRQFNLITDILIGFLVFVGFICVTVFAVTSLLKAGAAFGFFTFLLWIADAYFVFRKE